MNQVLGLVCGALLLVPVVSAQRTTHASLTARKIANAMSAAPAALASHATILDWPASDTTPPAVLRQGSNGWVCYPDVPGTQGNDPMCLDRAWQAWAQAYFTHQTERA